MISVRNKHSIQFFKWREHFSLEAKCLVSKYVTKLKEQINKENYNIEEFQPSEALDINSLVDSSQRKGFVKQSTFSLLSLVQPEIDDFEMIGINLNSLQKRKRKAFAKKKLESTLNLSSTHTEEPSAEELSKILHPPRLKYVPTPELMREQIMRACYIKNVDELIKDNTEFKLTL
mmetsp:Transcript_9952/g.11177  ORF Transcript_9952/g.11177 Transcript_9952/m.11177 type:complete len:175 (-) Transcript_9952:89-613(-)